MEALIQHFLIYSQGFKVPGRRRLRAGRRTARRARLLRRVGRHQSSRGACTCARPGLFACQALHKFVVGGMIADVIAVIGSLDVVMGDVDR
jgi:NADH-quinone oxidoreductase subunit D